MREEKETPERRRERLKQEEIRRNPTGGMNDAFNRASSGGLTDLVGSLGWKGTGILIFLIVIGVIIASFFFN
ncbi:DUF6366 family protein [Halalkalibacterium halodurans]|uniref:BH3698 protein n=1 Tax=Halalkalibacterium halodurans (strain ATCC BAA-125 / DSM 18197 / FERM 7344 / JCM 9153 / C-125) TaxID=272558 RepID=Q9K6N0_HALH5|nr:DUF6366 family protein [Halalkalibacterium halodurans]MED4083050.1 DUF6366 family protein [Halalkalibacterium halodurans]MED4086933.1 DUF6366 family protein [Halalkalibacterium halodurans]MED4107070.1 DUF6366 family protein [Halalkalibacterium halodurans]MED4110604.1 DUF6366 family protein [Halalkalibacterium halodurans]MED4151004.1 DUF6366 family protein [Halalkalibacterium halodurans]